MGHCPAVGVLFEPPGNPISHLVGLKVRGHVLGLVHRVHEGYTGSDVHFFALRRPAHRESEGQAAKVVRGRQFAETLAPGVLRQNVRRLECLPVVDAHGDDAVIGQPTVADGFHVALAVQFHAEGSLVVHGTDYPTRIPGRALIIVNARCSRLIDAVSGWEPVAVMADGKVAKTLFLLVGSGGFGFLPLQSCRSVCFVGNHHTRSDTGVQQGLGYPVAALVGAYQNLDTITVDLVSHPVGYFLGICSNPAFHLGRADIAVIDSRIECRVAFPLFLWVIARSDVGANSEYVHRNVGVLQVFAPYLGHERYGWTQHDRQLARRRQFFYDSKRNASLSRSAG